MRRPRSTRGRRRSGRAWARYCFGRLMQVIGLLVTLVSASAFFGTQSTTAMLRMMLLGVLIFVPGWLLARRDPGGA